MSIHSHSRSSSLEPWRSVKTAKEYRAMAEECAKWARGAQDDDVSAPLLQLAQRWLDAASMPASQVAPSLERPNAVK
jgi:hypothetical protein